VVWQRKTQKENLNKQLCQAKMC